MIDIDQVFLQLLNSVKYFPVRKGRTNMINTFAVLPGMSMVDSPNFGKNISYKDTSFFYSRSWEQLRHNPSRLQIDYPAMLVYETGQSKQDFFADKKNQSRYNIQVNVVDLFTEDANNKKLATDRVKEQIYIDTENLLFEALSYLKDVYVIETNDVSKLMHLGLIEKLNLQADIDKVASREFRMKLRSDNSNISGDRWEGGINNLYGTFTNLTFTLKGCEETEFDFDKDIIKPTVDKNTK